ncbi:MAG: tRNA (adenosine(37)-N6)-threonylcarbamoyltransferase complex transferase subunit TsaD, partial [Kiritimatiellae bacterium]|nr:tRNA (adenosine(37)-N6)-threonylcarbamoyltransferase complex transferase subunit TsaD [Kiritimatiellia bacterium]
FDKVARILGLSYPGGPSIAAAALQGSPERFRMPRPLMHSGRLDFSFSGLKTSLMVLLKREPSLKESRLADLAASYQEAVVDALMLRVVDALDHLPIQTLACAGGVARNARLREKLSAAADHSGVTLALTEPEFCADNAAMIAASARLLNTWADPVAADLDVLPGWGLGEDTGTPHH